jgi:arylsulfatase
LIEKYRGRYQSGWDTLREDKLARMKRLGIVGPDVVLPKVHSYGDERRPGFFDDQKVNFDGSQR